MTESRNKAAETIWRGRAVMLLDLDAFFASVEQLDHPEWRGKPVIVGGDADRRGVVATASYEARAFGVHSGMPASQAAGLCPDAIWTHARFERYTEISNRVIDIMVDESPFVQQVSIDEAFLDVTPSAHRPDDPVETAKRIQKRVDAMGVGCSIGLGCSKAVAKVASDMDKPRGLTVIYPGRERSFLSRLDIKRMSGVGPVAQKKLHEFAIYTMGDLAAAEHGILAEVFGKNAEEMRMRCMGADTDPVADDGPVKSISNEMSFARDIRNRRDVEAAISTVCAKVARRLRKSGMKAESVTLKVRYANLQARTVSCNLPAPSDDEFEFAMQLGRLLDGVWSEGMPIRLVGMAASRFGSDGAYQASLFDPEEDGQAPGSADERRAGLAAATDRVRDRFGEQAVMYGSEMRTRENLTGSAGKNPSDRRKPRT